MTKAISFKTKFGWISALENKGKITKIKFGKLHKKTQSIILNKFKRNIKIFFSKKIKKLDIPYEIKGNHTQKRVWNELKKIKYGKTKSYGQIAKKLNLSARYVGKICGQNKLLLLVPCHRVIRTDGSLGGFSSMGGIKLKKRLLELEQK